MQPILVENSTPTFSVIMPCYNASSYIAQSIESVLNQTFKDFELIVVDDASQDNSLSIIENFSRMDDRVKLVSLSENVGASSARNSAIQISTGKWISILDADDVFMPDKLERQYEAIKNSRLNVVLIGSNCSHIDAYGDKIGSFKYPTSSFLLKHNLRNMLKFPPHSSLVYLSSAFFEAGGFNSKFVLAEDYDLWLRLSEIGGFKCSNKFLIQYREHSENISNKTLEGDRSLLIYSISARVCQMLRYNNLPDPSTMQDDKQWNHLIEHIVNFVAQSEYQEYLLWKGRLKHTFQSKNIYSVLGSFGILVSSPFFLFALLREKIFHISNAPTEKIFKLWVECNNIERQ